MLNKFFKRLLKPLKCISSNTSLTKPDSEYLYVILPYFNYCKYKRRYELFVQFVKSMKDYPNVRVVITEGAVEGEGYQLPRLDCFLHIRNVIPSQLWIKENLINIAVYQLPDNWKYMAWIDADLTFTDPYWVEHTLKSLEDYDIVQLFNECANLGPNGEILKIDKSFGYMYRKSGKPYNKTSRYGFWHPGYAWACTRNAYDKMGGLIEFGILGSGDRHMALALIGLVDYSYPGTIHSNYKALLHVFQDKCISLRLGYVHGKILHHFHGSIADRKYVERWNILIHLQYDPLTDIYKNNKGVLGLTMSGKRLENPLKQYFVTRKEDGTKA
jgi:hypothetical protein